jgi:plasmid stabilization system protein ParE
MTLVEYSSTGETDLVAAITSIRRYFKDKNSVELGERHVAAFTNEMKKQEKDLQKHPTKYRVRDDGHFLYAAKNFRSFVVHWFTVFYSFEKSENKVVIWFIRPSRSDFSNIVYMDQSRSSE